MTATGHAVIGTVIAAKFGNPFLAIPLAFLSHIVADLFPHWDFGTHEPSKGRKRVMYEAILDVLVGFVVSFGIIFFIFPQTNPLYALLIILVAQGLDWGTAPYYFFNMKFPPFSWIYHFQKQFDTQLDKPWGIINQAAVPILLIIITKIF